MTINRISPAGLWSLATLVGLGAVVSSWAAVPNLTIDPQVLPDTPPPISATDTTVLGALAATIQAQNPFRIGRTPSDVRFDPMEPVPMNAESTDSVIISRPALILVGILGGPPWNALVDGIPEHHGSVLLRLGEQAGGIRFDQIRGDTVVLAGHDTTWTLTTNSLRQ
jgi:hypothetical protein